MRRLLVAMALVLLLAPKARAQGYLRPQPAPPALTPAQSAALAGYDNAALLALYMSQLASSGKAPTQADIDEAARQYFTNGAALATVPTSGPGAAYFQNGAAVMSYGATPPQSPSPTPTASVPPAPVAAPTAAVVAAPVPQPEPIPASAPEETTSAPGVTEAQAAAPTPPTPTEAPTASATATATPAAAPTPTPTSPAPNPYILYPYPVPTTDTEAALRCPPEPSLSSRLAAALGGLLFGGFAVALWLRPRMLRDSRARGDVAPK